MRAMKLFTLFGALLVALVPATKSFADISNAAVLYLRIAPGARAAAMGESYVAIADDATATHWNPAGLGSYPLSGTWRNSNVPNGLAPLTDIASLKARGGSNFMSYDVWAITPKGLARYDNKKWYLCEVINTKTTQTVEGIANSYFNIPDPDELTRVVKRIAVDNNQKSYDYLVGLQDKVLGQVKEGYSGLDALKAEFDSLLTGYDQCLVNWEYVDKIESLYDDGIKDSSLSETEVDRISFAVERSRNRFIPEQVNIYYSTLFAGQPKILASTDDLLAVGTDSGLYGFDGRRWKEFTTSDGLPSVNIRSMASAGGSVFIGTDSGVARMTGFQVANISTNNGLPVGSVSAVGATGTNDVWAVVDGGLYHYDGAAWSDSHKYTVVLDDTPEVLATKFSLYGTPDERTKFLDRLHQLNPPGSITMANPPADSATPDSAAMMIPRDTTTSAMTDSTKSSMPADTTMMGQMTPNATPTPGEDTAKTAANDSGPLALEAGQVINLPYVAEIKGKVNVIQPDANGRLWIGTDYGILRYDGSSWAMPGYVATTVAEGQTLDSIVAKSSRLIPMSEDTYRQSVELINNISESNPLTAGQQIKIYRNPAAAAINYIATNSRNVYFASDDGVIVYDGTNWGKLDQGGFNHNKAISAEAIGDEIWVAGDRRIVAKANGRTDISLMYVKWLPELASDLYYTFASLVTNKPGIGTFGGNITFISYGTIVRTNEQNVDLGSFDAFDVAFTFSYGGSLTDKLKGGISAKLLYSKLADQGAGAEKGKGTSTGFALDFGLMYHWTPRLNFGMAVTNLGPDMAYIDAAQSDPLPRNLAVGVAYKLLQNDFSHLLVTVEMNKSLVGVNDGIKEELKQVVFNGGGEFMYANLIAVRAGYIYDQEGQIKTVTLGIGLAPLSSLKFDFSYIPSNTSSVLANTLRISLSILP